MGKFSGMLLASDFDGTLANSRGEIPPFVREKLRYYIAEGGLFTVCTGRSAQGFHAFEPALINAPVLLCNGMMAYDYAAGRTVFADTINADAAAVLREIAARWKTVGFEFYTPALQTCVFRPDCRSRRHLEGQGIAYTELPSLDAAPFPFVKLMLSAGHETGREIQRFLDTLHAKSVRYIPTGGEMVELLAPGSDKGAGLLRLASALGIAASSVFAVGDGDNDLDILRAAAAAYVPANGCEEAKALATVIVPSNDEGAVGHVVDFLEQKKP